MSQIIERELQFRVAKVFSDHMVLQREKNIHIFGEGKPGTKVDVTLICENGRKITAKAFAENGKWLAVLPPMDAQTGCSLLVEAYETGEGDAHLAFSQTEDCCLQPTVSVTYTDVAIGEVWLCGGQSNMELELQNCEGGQDTLKQDVNINVRFYYTQKYGYKNQQFYDAEERSCWQTFDSESARAWSAVGYYFARKLTQELDGVTIGLLGCNWGGTSATSWMSREAILEDKDTASYIEEFESQYTDLSIEEQEALYDEYEAAHTAWDKKCAELYAKNPAIAWSEVEKILGPSQWPGPMVCKNPFRPSALYECMLQRVCPYSLRGFLYYQGESDDHKARMYYKLFTRMIRQWREDFLDEDLPFLLVQLPMHRYEADPDYKHWPIVREAQMDTYKTIKNTGIAVIIDRGEFNEIHPKDKLTVGERLTLQALAHVYGKLEEKDAFGPLYDNCIYHEDAMELHFKYAQDGFLIRGELDGFEIAGTDKVFVKADARIDGDKILISAPEVNMPRYARYLWTNYAEVTLYGKNGLPVAPFRTCKDDELTMELQSAKIQQIMEV